MNRHIDNLIRKVCDSPRIMNFVLKNEVRSNSNAIILRATCGRQCTYENWSPNNQIPIINIPRAPACFWTRRSKTNSNIGVAARAQIASWFRPSPIGVIEAASERQACYTDESFPYPASKAHLMSTISASPTAGSTDKMRRSDVRNIAIIAHVDHGKTTLVDCLLRQSGEFRASQLVGDCILDSNDLERERGITILAKNIALHYQGVKINLIDTPGHADFGGEVERVLRMADGALVLVDAAEGPMPQTRYVLSKALECGLQPIVVVNKIDRPDARSLETLDEAFELLMDLGGDHYLTDFPHIFATSKGGYATDDPAKPGDSMRPLFDMMLESIPGPEIDPNASLQMLVTNLDWSDYVGRIAVGRIYSGSIKKGQQIALMQANGESSLVKVAEVHVFDKLGRVEATEATAGDIAALVGLEKVTIGDTISDPIERRALPRVTVDEPTIQMVFSINSSPFVGREGKFVTSQHLNQRLKRELERNVALRVEPAGGMDAFQVFGRGVLHLSVLIETMRREGYELSIGKPHVVLHNNKGVTEEPFESLVVEVPHEKLGPVMELVGARRGQLVEMTAHDNYTFVNFSIPARGLIGLRTRLLNATQGTAVIHHRFDTLRPDGGRHPRSRQRRIGLDGFRQP